MKRQRDNTRAQRLAAHHESDRRPDRGVGACDVPHRDRRVDAWPEPAGRDDSNWRAIGRNNLRALARRRTAVRPHANPLPVCPIRERVFNPLGAGKAALETSALLDRPGESGFDWVYRLIELMPVEAKAGLEP